MTGWVTLSPEPWRNSAPFSNTFLHPHNPFTPTVTDTQTHTVAPYPTIAMDKPEREGTHALGSRNTHCSHLL